MGCDFYFPIKNIDGGGWGQTASNRNIPGGNWAFPVERKPFSSQYLLIGKTQKLKHILAYQSLQYHSSLSLFAIVKQCPAPTKPSTNIATPSLQVRVSRLLWRQLKVRLPRLCLSFSSKPFLCSRLFLCSQGTHPEFCSVRKCIRSAGLTPNPFWLRLQLRRVGVGYEGTFRWIKAMLLSPPTKNGVNRYHNLSSQWHSTLEYCNSSASLFFWGIIDI